MNKKHPTPRKEGESPSKQIKSKKIKKPRNMEQEPENRQDDTVINEDARSAGHSLEDQSTTDQDSNDQEVGDEEN